MTVVAETFFGVFGAHRGVVRLHGIIESWDAWQTTDFPDGTTPAAGGREWVRTRSGALALVDFDAVRHDRERQQRAAQPRPRMPTGDGRVQMCLNKHDRYGEDKLSPYLIEYQRYTDDEQSLCSAHARGSSSWEIVYQKH